MGDIDLAGSQVFQEAILNTPDCSQVRSRPLCNVLR